MATKQNRRTQMTRLLLRTALVELMQEKPIEKISIKDICDQADLNRTTFYLHYPDQHALLLDVQQDIKAKLKPFQEENLAKSAIPTTLISFLAYIRDNAKTFQVLMHHAGTSDFRRDLTQFAVSLFWPDQKQKSRKEQYAQCYLLNGCFGIIFEWIDRSLDLTVEGLASLILEFAESTVLLVEKNNQ